LDLALKCEGLRHVVAVSSPGAALASMVPGGCQRLSLLHAAMHHFTPKSNVHINAILYVTGCNSNQQAIPVYEEPGQAKSSMEHLVRVFAKKLAKDNINVNCVIPGFVRTEAWEHLFKVIGSFLGKLSCVE
jgi:NAD(P)-dependent dehydrogenase (short-subunit alcohol dehydrogenase family)